MSAKNPPRFAVGLLERFGASPALTGDLIERYARGRSGLWFWRQTIAAIAVCVMTDIRNHKLLLLRSVLVYIVAINAFAAIPYRVRAWMYGPVFGSLELRLIASVVYLAAGWLVGRLHRPHAASMITGVIVLAWLYSTPSMWHSMSNVLQHERFRPYVYGRIMNGVEATMCLLIGGLLSAPTRTPSTQAPERPST